MQAVIEGDLSGIVESAELALIAGGFVGTEGPLWHPAGFLTFVDLEGDKLLRWDAAAGLRVLRHPNGHGNGCTLDGEGRLVMCDGDGRAIVRLEQDGRRTVLADRSDGRRLNRPNDIIRRSDGTFFFTDPGLFVPEDQRDLPVACIFRLSRDGRLDVVATDPAFPNGLALSPDESVLYVTNSFLDKGCLGERERGEVCSHRYLAAYDVSGEGDLSNFRKVTDLSSSARDVPDGLKVDRKGAIFCTGSGAVWVLDPAGGLIGKIRTPEPHRNCAFGGSDMRTLYISTLTSIYSIRVRTPGISGTGN